MDEREKLGTGSGYPATTSSPQNDNRAAQRAEDERLVLASRAGDATAFPALFDRWFDPCVDVAWRILHDRDAAADVAQETFLAAWRELDRLREPASFGGWVLRTARNRALNRLASSRRSAVLSDMSDDEELTAALDGKDGSDETASAVEQAEGAELVWAASAALGQRDASVLDLHLRHGFTAPEIAETLGVTANNAHQLLFRLKRKLGGAIQAWVLWPAASRPGVAGCTELRRAIEDSGVTRFGPEAVRVVDRHARDCDDCQERRQLRVAPEVLFGAVPIIPAGSVLRARAVAALQADGVPLPSTPPPDAGASSGGDATAPSADGGAPPGDPAADPSTDGGTSSGEAPGPSSAAPGDPSGGEAAARSGRRRWARVAVGAVVAAVVLAGLVIAVSAGGGDADDDEVAAVQDGEDTDPPSSTVPTSATTVPPPTSTTVAPTSEVPSTTVAEPTTTTTDGTGTTTNPPPDPDPPAPPDPDPDPAPPEITAFSGDDAPPGPPCASHQRRVILAWESTGADTAELAGPGAPGGGLGPSGEATACVDPGSGGSGPVTFTLTVTGPGGTATSDATV